MATKYAPLRTHLAEAAGARLRLSFREIEGILGFELPRSAREYAPWWANTGGSHVQAEAWLSTGWRTCDVDVAGEAVSFERASDVLPSVERDQGVSETAAPFVRDRIVVDHARLSNGALRLLEDYCEAEACDLSDAVTRILNEMALERRRQIVAWFRANVPPVPGDSTDIIREDRDAR